MKITGNEGVPKCYLGAYGKVIEENIGDKWLVELRAGAENIGFLRHYINKKDFEVV